MSWPQVRGRAVDRIFARLGEAADWSGVTDPVTVIPRDGDDIAGSDAPGLVMATHFIRVRRSEVVEPAAGDVIDLLETGGRFVVTGSPRIDRKGVWRCEVLEA